MLEPDLQVVATERWVRQVLGHAPGELSVVAILRVCRVEVWCVVVPIRDRSGNQSARQDRRIMDVRARPAEAADTLILARPLEGREQLAGHHAVPVDHPQSVLVLTLNEGGGRHRHRCIDRRQAGARERIVRKTATDSVPDHGRAGQFQLEPLVVGGRAVGTADFSEHS